MIRFNYHTKVYYKDVDQMGIVYYSRYFEYFEAARTELLRNIGLDVTTLESDGYYLPVIVSHCDYKGGAGLEDEIVVETIIPKTPKSKLRIEYRLHRKGENKFLVTGYTIHAFINKHSGKPCRPPKSFIQTITTFFLQNNYKE